MFRLWSLKNIKSTRTPVFRYYYSRGILNRVDGQRLVYQFANEHRDVSALGDI